MEEYTFKCDLSCKECPLFSKENYISEFYRLGIRLFFLRGQGYNVELKSDYKKMMEFGFKKYFLGG